MASYTAAPVPVPSRTARAAELVFRGIEQAGPSFEGRVFLNHPDADETTPRTVEMGYGGSFHVYAYGEAAPPAIAEAKRSGAAGPVAPIEKRVPVDETALRAALRDSDELTVTVVAVPTEPDDSMPERPFQELTVLFDRASSSARP